MHHQVEEFLLDTGDALEMVTPSLKTKLGLMAPTTGTLHVLNIMLCVLRLAPLFFRLLCMTFIYSCLACIFFWLGSVTVEGTTVGGSRSYDIVELVGASVGGHPLPTLHATVSDFPQVDW